MKLISELRKEDNAMETSVCKQLIGERLHMEQEMNDSQKTKT